MPGRVQPPPSFGDYTNAQSPDTRFEVRDGAVREQGGRRSPFNVFARVWNWMTRSPEQAQRNKDTADLFVREMGQKYGDSIGNMASRQLSAHTAHGRPLTYRINEILRKANDMIETNAQKNRRSLQENLRSITESAAGAAGMRRAGDVPAWQLDVVHAAVESDPGFTGQPEFLQKEALMAICAPIAEQALRQMEAVDDLFGNVAVLIGSVEEMIGRAEPMSNAALLEGLDLYYQLKPAMDAVRHLGAAAETPPGVAGHCNDLGGKLNQLRGALEGKLLLPELFNPMLLWNTADQGVPVSFLGQLHAEWERTSTVLSGIADLEELSQDALDLVANAGERAATMKKLQKIMKGIQTWNDRATGVVSQTARNICGMMAERAEVLRQGFDALGEVDIQNRQQVRAALEAFSRSVGDYQPRDRNYPV